MLQMGFSRNVTSRTGCRKLREERLTTRSMRQIQMSKFLYIGQSITQRADAKRRRELYAWRWKKMTARRSKFKGRRVKSGGKPEEPQH